MAQITSLTALTEIYGAPAAASLTKVSKTVSPLYRDWIMKSRFCVLSTVGPDGAHATPRGDDTSAVQVPDSTTILLPDWPGNKRIDALRDIVADGRASLMFMAPGNNNVVRVNGTAVIDDDMALRQRFEFKGKVPITVVVITVDEVLFQCARALLRSALWSAEHPTGLATAGEFLAEQSDGEIDAVTYDTDWNVRGPATMY